MIFAQKSADVHIWRTLLSKKNVRTGQTPSPRLRRSFTDGPL